MILAVS